VGGEVVARERGDPLDQLVPFFRGEGWQLDRRDADVLDVVEQPLVFGEQRSRLLGVVADVARRHRSAPFPARVAHGRAVRISVEADRACGFPRAEVRARRYART
jgi:hypothetical protein